MRNIIVTTVEKAGYTNVKSAENGRDALAELMVGDFDFLLTDWIMPVMNGLELIKAIREDERLRNLPVIMVTSKNLKENILSAVNAGVNGYITKPFSTIMLKRKIHEILRA